MGFFSKFFSKEKKETLDQGLSASKQSILSKIARAIASKKKVDDDFLDDLEEILITSDVGVDTTLAIIERLNARVKKDGYVDSDELTRLLSEETQALLADSDDSVSSPDFTLPQGCRKPYVIMVVGVNGAGKTSRLSIAMPDIKLCWARQIHSALPLSNSLGSGRTERMCLL